MCTFTVPALISISAQRTIEIESRVFFIIVCILVVPLTAESLADSARAWHSFRSASDFTPAKLRTNYISIGIKMSQKQRKNNQLGGFLYAMGTFLHYIHNTDNFTPRRAENTQETVQSFL